MSRRALPQHTHCSLSLLPVSTGRPEDKQVCALGLWRCEFENKGPLFTVTVTFLPLRNIASVFTPSLTQLQGTLQAERGQSACGMSARRCLRARLKLESKHCPSTSGLCLENSSVRCLVRCLPADDCRASSEPQKGLQVYLGHNRPLGSTKRSRGILGQLLRSHERMSCWKPQQGRPLLCFGTTAV